MQLTHSVDQIAYEYDLSKIPALSFVFLDMQHGIHESSHVDSMLHVTHKRDGTEIVKANVQLGHIDCRLTSMWFDYAQSVVKWRASEHVSGAAKFPAHRSAPLTVLLLTAPFR